MVQYASMDPELSVYTKLYFTFSSAGVSVLDHSLASAMDWMRVNKLKLNPDKSKALFSGLFPRPDGWEAACP